MGSYPGLLIARIPLIIRSEISLAIYRELPYNRQTETGVLRPDIILMRIKFVIDISLKWFIIIIVSRYDLLFYQRMSKISEDRPIFRPHDY